MKNKFRNHPKPRRSALSAFQHPLSGNHLIMQQHEFTAYERLSLKMLADLNPATEPEKQIAQKIIDLNFRINRLTAIENNMLNFDMGSNEPGFEEDEGLARMMGQARAWKKEAQSFDILGRYEARLSKQLLQYQNELTRMQTARALSDNNTLQSRDATGAVAQAGPIAPLHPESPSFGETPPAYVMAAELSQPTQNTALNPESASFGRLPQAA